MSRQRFFRGLKIAGIEVKINTKRFANDLTTFNGNDDVLTLLVHFGYLAYDSDTGNVRFHNVTVADVIMDISFFINITPSASFWFYVSDIPVRLHDNKNFIRFQAVWDIFTKTLQ